MASLLNIGVTGLRAQQAGLAVTGQNITNASTPGYSRQQVDLSTATTGLRSDTFGGAGVHVESIRRITNEFSNRQVQADTAMLSEMDTLVNQMQQLESILFDEGTGLSSALQDFFSAVQDVSNAPESLPERQLVLERGKALAARFQNLNEKLHEQIADTQNQLSAAVAEVNELTSGIVGLNSRIQALQHDQNSGALNGLLDQRDELIRKLSQHVAVTTETQQDGSVNIYIGKGQPLAVGTTLNELSLSTSGDVLLGLSGTATKQNITSSVSGGKLGALIQHGNQTLNETLNGLGRIAYSLTESINSIHRGGIDLEGDFGGDLFKDMNQPPFSPNRVIAEQLTIQGQSGVIDVRLGKPSDIVLSNYEISFDSNAEGSFVIKRLSDNTIAFQGALNGNLPQTLSFDGLELSLMGGDFNPGDRYRIQPFNDMAGQVALTIQDPRQLALALPARAESSLGNSGSGRVEIGDFFDQQHPIFGGSGELAPPLLIRFTTEDRYDILDNTDPSNPIDLIPPRRHQRYIPGQSNSLLPESVDRSIVQSNRASLGDISHGSEITTGIQKPLNGNVEETLIIQRFSTAGEVVSSQQLQITGNQSAAEIAAQFNTIPGISATASTDITISQLDNNGVGTVFDVVINGERFSNIASLAELSDAITSNLSLRQAGIRAQSDGNSLSLQSITGEDLDIHVSGDPTDGITIENSQGQVTRLNGAGPGEPAQLLGTGSLANGHDFSVGGPYTLDLTLEPGNTAISIGLTGTYADQNDLLNGLQTQLDSATGSRLVELELDASGTLILRSVTTGPEVALNLSLSSAASGVLNLNSGTASGDSHYRSIAIGGGVSVEMDSGFKLQGGGKLFATDPTHFRSDLGFSLSLHGRPMVGDEFNIDFNQNATGDNRNSLLLAQLSLAKTVGNPPVSLTESYAGLIQEIGLRSAKVQIDKTAAQSLLQQSISQRESISGVNLDEEAANLIRYEQAYNAAAQIISVARETFDVLINAVR